MRILLLGGGAREHAIAESLCRSTAYNVELLTISHNYNPGLAELSSVFLQHDEKDEAWIAKWARQQAVDFAVIGLEDPLDTGVTDALNDIGVPTVGPSQSAARVETSKLFTRDLMRKYNILGQVHYHYFVDCDSLEGFLSSSDKEFALKPVGLTAGKGVKVMGVQLGSVEEAIEYGKTVIRERIGGVPGIIVEERLLGEEFTLQAFVDGEAIAPMPLVQDYKRAFEGNQGPNTGSMGSYSQSDGLLPFVMEQERDQALDVLRQVVLALENEGHPYKGIMYGQFMMTSEGIKLVEINARFGDPEAINVLPLLETDFVDVCLAIIGNTLHRLDLCFARQATVCKYITPPGYPTNPKTGVPLKVHRRSIESLGVRVYFAKLDETDGQLLTTTSRAIALLGTADSVEEAETSVEKALAHIEGEYHVRHDIAKQHLRQSSLDRIRLYQMHSEPSTRAMGTTPV